MEIYLRTLSKSEGVTDALITEGLQEKVMGIKLVTDKNVYYIEEGADGQLGVRTLNGIMWVKPQAENSVLVKCY